MNTLSFTSLITHSLAWALLYSLWQGLLVYGLMYVLLKALGNISARAKYYLSVSSFGLLFAWFADTWMTQYQKLKGITVYIRQGSGQSLPVLSHQPSAVAAIDSGSSSLVGQSLAGLERYSSLIIILYSIGLGLMLLRFAINIYQVRVLKNTGIAAPQAHLNELVAYWQEQFNLSRPVKLLLSSRVDVPMMLGVLKPVILLPVATINHLSIDQLEAILMHELAHIKRQDYVLNILQTIGETILFFNPFVWLISAVIRRERENCCDDMVVAYSADPIPYVHALAILETNRYNGSLSLAATGKNKNQLLNRIKRIMEMKKQNINYGQMGIMIMAFIAIVCSVAVFTPSFAQKAKNKKTIEAAKVPATSGSTNTTSTYTYEKVIVDSNGHKTVTNKTVTGNGDEDVQVSFYDDDFSANMHGALSKAIDNVATAAMELATAMTKQDEKEMEREMEQAKKEMKKASEEMRIAHRDMKDAQKEIDAVDWAQVKAEINKGLAEAERKLNDPKLKREISIELRKALEESKSALEEAKLSLNKKKVAIAIAANEDGDVSSSNTGSVENMLDRMEDEGLINRKRGFSIVKKNDKLTINGERQSDAVYERYSKDLKGKKVAISGAKGSLSISIDN